MKYVCPTSTVFCTGMQRYCQQLWLGECNMWYTAITTRCSIAKIPLHKENWPWKPTGLTVRERIYYPSITWTRMGTLSVVQIINKNDRSRESPSWRIWAWSLALLDSSDQAASVDHHRVWWVAEGGYSFDVLSLAASARKRKERERETDKKSCLHLCKR